MQSREEAPAVRPLTSKEFEILCPVILCLQQIVQWHLCIRAGDHHVARAAVNGEHSDFVRGEGEINAIPLPFAVPAPLDQDAFVGERAGRVFVGAELERATGALQFTFMLPLFAKGHDEAPLSLFVLQCHHGLFDVVVVCLELLLQIDCLLVKPRQSGLDIL